MCLNCGCMMPEDNMGNPDNITLETLRKAARASGHRNIKDVMEMITRTYQKKVKGTDAETSPVAKVTASRPLP